MGEALTCPFCGREPKLQNNRKEYGQAHKASLWSVICICGASVDGASKSDALRTWNRRDSRDPEVESLRQQKEQAEAACAIYLSAWEKFQGGDEEEWQAMTDLFTNGNPGSSLLTELAALRERVKAAEKLRPYLSHFLNCAVKKVWKEWSPCTCGLDQILVEFTAYRALSPATQEATKDGK